MAPSFLAVSACGRKTLPASTLRIGMIGGPDSLDPMKAEFAAANLLFRQFWMPVVGYGQNGAPAPGPSPSMAQSWSPSADFKIWTFTIKDGLTWSDGKPITALDIRDSLRLGADAKTVYPDASELYMIKGYRDCVVDGKDPASIGVSAPDARTLVIELNVADAGFPSRMQEFYPVPIAVRAALGEAWTQPQNIVVSGPYKPSERTQSRIVLSNNPLGGWTPEMPETMIVEAIEDSATRLRMFQAGDLDLVQDPPLMRAQELTKEFGSQYQTFPAPRFIYLTFNTKKPQFSDPDVRRALAMSIDRDVIARTIMRGSVEPAGRFVRGEEQPAYDPQTARAILEGKGYNAANPLTFELLVSKDDRERAAIQMSEMWKQVGAQASMFAADSSAIVARLNGFDFEAAVNRIDKGMKSDPIDLMASWGEGGTAYSHQWKDPAFDAALAVARAQSDPVVRRNKVLAAEAILRQATPVSGIWFFPSAWLVHPRVTGGIEGVAPIIWPTLRLKAA